MSNAVIVAGVRAAIAANLATKSVTWHQYPNSSYDAATGASGAAVDTPLSILMYEHKKVQDDAGTENETIEGIVILEDLPGAIGKSDCFTWNNRWRISELMPDPTDSFVEFKAYR